MGAPTRRVSAEAMRPGQADLARALAGVLAGTVAGEDLTRAATCLASSGDRLPVSWLGWRFQHDVVGLRVVRFRLSGGGVRASGEWTPVAVLVGLCHSVWGRPQVQGAVVEGLSTGPQVRWDAEAGLAWARQVLGVGAGADQRGIQLAFRDRVRAVHPDTGARQGRVDIGQLVDARDALLAEWRDRTAGETGGQ